MITLSELLFELENVAIKEGHNWVQVVQDLVLKFNLIYTAFSTFHSSSF